MNTCSARSNSTSKQPSEGEACPHLCASESKFVAAPTPLPLHLKHTLHQEKYALIKSINNVNPFIRVCMCFKPVQNMTSFTMYFSQWREAVVQVPNLKIFMHTDPA